jgi:integrase
MAKKRTDGRMQKSFTHNGKRYYVYATTARELDKKVYEKIQELEHKKQDHDDPTLNSFYEKWTENRRDSIKESTIRCQHFQYKACADVSIDGKKLGEFRLSEIKPDDIRIVQKEIVKNNTTQTTNDKIAVLSHIFHDAIRERYIDYNPCSPVRPLKRTEERARDTIHRALTIEETRAFFKAAEKSFYYDVYRIAINTGMRVGEIGALYASDIYNSMIHVNRTITKTGTGSYRIGEDGKTKHATRTIPLNDSIIEILEHQKMINRMLDGDKVTSINEVIFKAPERGLLMSTPVDREITRICKRIGIEKFTLHALRATFATRCIEQGMNPRTLQELLGHADFSLTMNLYGHVVDDTKIQAMNNLQIAL